MDSLKTLSELRAPLEFLLTADNDEKMCTVKQEIVEDVAHAIAKELKTQNLADCDGDYLEPYAFNMAKKIKNSEIRNLHILIG